MSSVPTVDDLIARLRGRIDDPAKQELIADIASDAVRVTTIAMVDPERGEREAAHLKAQALNLTAGEAIALQTEWMHWAQAVVGALVGKALASL